MTTTFIISEEKLRQFTDINDNLDSKLIKNAVREAQDIYLQRLTGTSLYEYILAQIDANTLTGEYKKLVDDFQKFWKEYQQQKKLSIAFIGQYNAGKSKINSRCPAISGRRKR